MEFLVARAIRSGPGGHRGREHSGKLAETQRICGAPVELGKKVFSPEGFWRVGYQRSPIKRPKGPLNWFYLTFAVCLPPCGTSGPCYV
jgi:hypothetical protein